MKKLFTLFIVILFSNIAFAQIPNPGFESWDTFATYKSPVGWANLDSFTNLAGVYTCERDSPAFAGNYYLKLTSKTCGSAVAPGVAVSGLIDYTSYTAKSGFPFSSRPQSLAGEWQHMIFGSSQGFVSVFLSKWNTSAGKRDTIAFVNHTLYGMVMSWGPFSIDLKYYSGVNPDSAIIVLSASGTTPTNNDYLYVDSLVFTGSVPIGTITLNSSVVDKHPSSVTVYPNPASGSTSIAYYSTAENAVKISINDLNGRILKEINAETIRGENNFTVNTSDFASGVYFIKIIDDQGIEVKKLILQ